MLLAEVRVRVRRILHGLADPAGVHLLRDASRGCFLKLDPLPLPAGSRRHGSRRMCVQLLLGSVLACRVGPRGVVAERLVAWDDALRVISVLHHFAVLFSFYFLNGFPLSVEILPERLSNAQLNTS